MDDVYIKNPGSDSGVLLFVHFQIEAAICDLKLYT